MYSWMRLICVSKIESGSTVTPNKVRQSGTAKGGNVGVDASYRFTPRLAGGLFLRFVPATAHLESISNLKVGGGQFGIGLRVNF